MLRIRPSDRSGNDSANGGDAADMRFLSRVEKVEARDEVVVLENERKKSRPPPPALTSRGLHSAHMHHVMQQGAKARGQSSKQVCGGSIQYDMAAIAVKAARLPSHCCDVCRGMAHTLRDKFRAGS